MRISDLLFLGVLLAFIATVIAAAIAAIRGQAARAFRMLRNLGICAVVYLATAIIVSRVLPLHVLNIGYAQCSGAWRIAVESVKRLSPDNRSRRDTPSKSRPMRRSPFDKSTVVRLE